MTEPASRDTDTAALRMHVVEPDEDLARRALRTYIDDVASRWYGRPATRAEVDAALAQHSIEHLLPPHGLLVVLSQDQNAVGCAGLRFVGAGLGEVTRLHVHESYRGQGLGRRLMLRVEELARDHQVQTLRLDTRTDLVEARSLYQALGYVDVPAFNEGPYAQHWLSKTLS